MRGAKKRRARSEFPPSILFLSPCTCLLLCGAASPKKDTRHIQREEKRVREERVWQGREEKRVDNLHQRRDFWFSGPPSKYLLNSSSSSPPHQLYLSLASHSITPVASNCNNTATATATAEVLQQQTHTNTHRKHRGSTSGPRDPSEQFTKCSLRFPLSIPALPLLDQSATLILSLSLFSPLFSCTALSLD